MEKNDLFYDIQFGGQDDEDKYTGTSSHLTVS